MEGTLLDQYIQRLQNMSPFNLHAVQLDGTVAPWYEVTGEIVKDVVLREDSLALQVGAIATQILHWGRNAAQAKRVWEITEREYRVWRGRKILELSTPPADAEAAKGWKKPTEAIIEAQYQSHPEYSVMWQRTERAEEAFNAATAILDAFKAKRDMIKIAVVRSHENGQPRLSV